MASPRKQADPSSDNRAKSILFGTHEPEKFDPDALAASVVEVDVSPVVSEGNILAPEPEQAAAPATTAPEQEPAPQPEQAAAPATTAPTADPDEIDDPRFKGKSKSELYKAYQNLERLKGEHDKEVSEYRKLFMERVIKPDMEAAQAKQQPSAAPAEDDTTLLNEMLTSPKQFQKKLIEQSKKELFNELSGAARMNEIQQVKAAKQAVISSPEFTEWLVNNVPQHVAAAADQDVNTFNFIMKFYEAAGHAAQAKPTEPTPDRRIPIGSAAGVPAASSATPGTQKPIAFRQAELAEMMMYRPEEYARRQPEILAAYREGRIK